MVRGGRSPDPQSEPAERDDIAPEQVAELFRNVAVGVLGAAFASVILAVTAVQLDNLPTSVATAWALLVCSCAACHLGLRHGYLRARAPAAAWRFWGGWFTAIALAEGILWGWGSVSLASVDRVDLQLLVQVVTYAVAAGAIPAFSSFFPAFLALFFPTVIPFMVWSAIQGSGIHTAAVILCVVYIYGMAGLGWRANRNFLAALRLRFEKERLAESLRQQKELAEQANLAKSRFLAAASHDLRQPVHALSLFIGALRGLNMEDEARRLVGHIEGSVTAMDELFGSLLDISRLDAGIVQANPQSFPVQPLLERICRDLQAEAAEKGIRLVLHPCDAVVHTDPLLLERILRNLLSNAVRYTDQGRVVIGCRRGTALRIQVLDTGRGIPPAMHQQVFQEFFQLGNPERDRAKGLGLGLAIVKRLTALLEMPLDFRSVPDRGTAFSVTVPLGLPQDAAAAMPQGPVPSFVPHGLILVIDDEAAIQEAMRSLLTSWGHQVIVAGSGAEMLERTADCARPPDLIICDYRLRGGENGIGVIERLQSEFNDEIPAVLITGDTAPERLIEAQSSGLLLLHKPVANAKLRAAIGHLMGGRVEVAEA